MAKQQQQVTLLGDNSVGQILQGVRDSFSGIIERSRIQAIIDFSKESALARQIIGKDTRLQQCTEVSIKNAFMNVAFTGLSLNPVKQHATLIARWNYDLSKHEAQLLIMYRGLMWLAGQAGVTDISVDVAYTADKIKIWKTDEGDKYEHEIAIGVPRDGISSKFLGVYVAAKMPGSTRRKVEWIPCEDIYMARSKSDSYLDKKSGEPNPKSPWVWTFDEMAKKVGIKRAQKRWEEAVIPTDEWKRFQTAVALDNANDGIIPARASDIPGTAEHVQAGNDKPAADPPAKLSMAQITELEKLAEVVAPNSDKFPTNTSGYLTKIARTYQRNLIGDVDATKFDEIKGRINEAINKQKAKKAAGSQEGTQGKGNPAVNKDAPASGGGKGSAGGDKQKSGEASGGAASTGGSDRPADREPGSDDDAGSGDPGPTDPDKS